MTAMKDLWKNKAFKYAIATCGLIILTCFTIRIEQTKAEELSDVINDEIEKSELPPLNDSINTPSSLSFINDSICYISDSTNSLHPFLLELEELLSGKDTVISIVHLGDSHIQAGYLSGQTMRLLQHSFGNAGRGWIAPLKLSKVNEPSDYFISSNIKEWTTGRCIQNTPKCPWGIGGIGIQSESPEIDFDLIIAPNNGAGYSFNKVMLYRDEKAMPMAPYGNNKDSISQFLIGKNGNETIAIDTFTINQLVDSLSLKSIGRSKDSANATGGQSNRYYGFLLTNGHSGVLYNSIGVNGATYANYTNRNYLRQLSLLKPSLLIISLGTNEAYGRNFSKAVFESQIGEFVKLVHEELPNTKLLITTPAESYKRIRRNKKRIYVCNDNVSKVADVITNYAQKEGIAYWDMYSITGGKNSCTKWFKAGMFGRDRIHFSQNAYAEQGTLLYKAIIRSCIADKKTSEDITAVNNAPTEEVKHVE